MNQRRVCLLLRALCCSRDKRERSRPGQKQHATTRRNYCSVSRLALRARKETAAFSAVDAATRCARADALRRDAMRAAQILAEAMLVIIIFRPLFFFFFLPSKPPSPILRHAAAMFFVHYVSFRFSILRLHRRVCARIYHACPRRFKHTPDVQPHVPRPHAVIHCRFSFVHQRG